MYNQGAGVNQVVEKKKVQLVSRSFCAVLRISGCPTPSPGGDIFGSSETQAELSFQAQFSFFRDFFTNFGRLLGLLYDGFTRRDVWGLTDRQDKEREGGCPDDLVVRLFTPKKNVLS